MSMSDHANTARLRRLAARHGEQLVKLRENSRWYSQYGPFMTVDPSTNAILAAGLDADDLDEHYANA